MLAFILSPAGKICALIIVGFGLFVAGDYRGHSVARTQYISAALKAQNDLIASHQKIIASITDSDALRFKEDADKIRDLQDKLTTPPNPNACLDAGTAGRVGAIK